MPLPPQLRVLILARCVNRLGGFSMAFLGVLLVRDLDAGPAGTAVALTCFGLATIPSRILGGHLADAWGHRPTMLLGLVGCAAAQLVIAAAPTYAWALVGAVLLGLAYEVVEPPTQALVSDLVPERARAFAYSALNASLAVAGILAGLVAAAVSGFGLRWLFVIDAATCLACALLVGKWALDENEAVGKGALDEKGGATSSRVPISPHAPASRVPSSRHAPARRVPSSAREPVRARQRWTAALADPRLHPVIAFGTVVATVTMVVVFGVPLLVEQRGLTPAVTGWVLAAGAAASVPGASGSSPPSGAAPTTRASCSSARSPPRSVSSPSPSPEALWCSQRGSSSSTSGACSSSPRRWRARARWRRRAAAAPTSPCWGSRGGWPRRSRRSSSRRPGRHTAPERPSGSRRACCQPPSSYGW